MADTAEPIRHEAGASLELKVTVLPHQAIDEMVAKIVTAAEQPAAAGAVASWRDAHGDDGSASVGHHHVVVAGDLMYLHDAPDGTLVPHVRRPDGTEEIFTDPEHAEALF